MSESVVITLLRSIYLASITSTFLLQPPKLPAHLPWIITMAFQLVGSSQGDPNTLGSWEFPVTPHLTESKSQGPCYVPQGPKWCAPPSTVSFLPPVGCSCLPEARRLLPRWDLALAELTTWAALYLLVHGSFSHSSGLYSNVTLHEVFSSHPTGPFRLFPIYLPCFKFLSTCHDQTYYVFSGKLHRVGFFSVLFTAVSPAPGP